MPIDRSFSPQLATVPDWAHLYRGLGLQVVPVHEPREGINWKRPALKTWREHQSSLASDEVFSLWYGERGQHLGRTNLGLLTGKASGGTFVVDLDTHNHPDAALWWECVQDLQQKAGELETATQTTGGGGKQLLFRAPSGWSPPTCKTPIGVDIRGEGGFAVLPPSRHISGQSYRWDEGLEPWEVGIAQAPMWLCREIDKLAETYGAARGGAENGDAGPVIKTPTPAATLNAFGMIEDGRETYMTRVIWAAVVGEYRQSPIQPDEENDQQIMRRAFEAYERNTKSRLREPGVPNHILLEREGRGITLFRRKWEAAMRQWDGKVARHAATPPQLERAIASSQNIQQLSYQSGEVSLGGNIANDQASSGQMIVTSNGWMAQLVTGKNGKLIANASNIDLILKNHPDWIGVLGFDEFNERIVVQSAPSWVDTATQWHARLINDDDIFATIAWMNRFALPTLGNSALVAAGVDAAARANSFHPIRAYLDNLRWDGVTRLDSWLNRYCAATPTEAEAPFYSAAGTKFFIGAVARIYTPGCKHDAVLILEGPQGAGKSTAFKILCGADHFGDALPPMATKDASAYLRGKWIVELSELAAISRIEVEPIKAFLTRTEERFRPAYGRYEVRYKRQCVFAGSTNRASFLRDETGNRRFWPVRVGRIDISALERDKDQLWAEAVTRYRAGEDWWLSGTLINVASGIQRERAIEDPWTGLVADYLANKGECSIMDAADAIGLSPDRVGTSESNRIVAILTQMGWTRQGRFKTRDRNRDAARYVAPESEDDSFG